MFAVGSKNIMLDALTPNLMSLHDGDPGAAGTANEISSGSYSRESCTFNAASNGERLLNADVEFEAAPSQAVTHAGVWNSSGPTWIGSIPLTGDLAFNAEGELAVKAGTKLALEDPS